MFVRQITPTRHKRVCRKSNRNLKFCKQLHCWQRTNNDQNQNKQSSMNKTFYLHHIAETYYLSICTLLLRDNIASKPNLRSTVLGKHIFGPSVMISVNIRAGCYTFMLLAPVFFSTYPYTGIFSATCVPIFIVSFLLCDINR